MYIIDFFDKEGTRLPDSKQFKTDDAALEFFDKYITSYINNGGEDNISALEVYDEKTDDIIKEWDASSVQKAIEQRSENESLEEELEPVPEEHKSDKIAKFIEELYDLRKESIATEGEYGLGNLVFKEFRNLGYLDNLKELRKQEKTKELSLEQLKQADDILNATNNYVVNEYRKYAQLEDEELITEENLNEYALNRTSAYTNYDKEELKNLLLNRSK